MIAKIRALYRKHRETVDYIVYGTLTTFINWIVYGVCNGLLGIGQTTSNAIAWVVALIYAFIVNKHFVFRSRDWSAKVTLREAASFVGGRALSGAIEIVGPTVLTELGLDQTMFGMDGLLSKAVILVVVLALNYVFSKFFAFSEDGKGAGKVARIIYAVLCVCAVVFALWYSLLG